MTRKRKVRVAWLNEWQVLEHEAWFEDMARQGWQLENMGYWFTTFTENEPEEINYRIEIANKNDAIESDRIHLYEDAGWDYVTSKNHLYVFREKEVNKGREIHTDPIMQAETMEVLKKSIWRNGILILLSTFLFGTFFLMNILNMSSYQLLNDGVLNSMFYIIVYVPVSLHWIGGMFRISSLIKKIKRGEAIKHYKAYQGKVNRIRIGALLIVALYITFFSFFFYNERTFSQAERYPEIPSEPLPVIQLTEVEDIESNKVAYHTNGIARKRENHFFEGESIFFPKQYRLRQQFIVPEDISSEQTSNYEPSIDSNKYEARTVGLAESLTECLLEEAHWQNPEYPEQARIRGFDEVWVFESSKYVKIIARNGKYVYDIYYYGNQSSRVFHEWLEGIGGSHSSS